MKDIFAMTERFPPVNIQAEHALLGAVLSNAKTLHSVIDFLRPEHFSDPVHGRIYREASRRILAGGIADPVSMQTWFAGDPDGETLGITYLAKLLTAMVSIIAVKDYGLAIYECWQRREMIGIGEDLVNRSYSASPDDPPALMISGMIDKLDAAGAGAADMRKAVSMNDAMDAALAAADRAAKNDRAAGVSTGMRSADMALGGLEAQTLTILAGRPGMGKSALGWTWAVNAARDALTAHKRGGAKQGVLVISLEMSSEQLGRRALSTASGIPLSALKHGRLSQHDSEKLVQARRELDGLPLSIEDCSGLSMGMIRLKARSARRRHGLGLIVIDHLHIVRPEDADARNGGTWAIGKISNGMKQLAKEFECPVLALAQLNRGLESREEKRPTLADLRQAGEIEQDADAVAFIYRPEYYLSKGQPEQRQGESRQAFSDRVTREDGERTRLAGKAELIFAKVRDGSPCTVPLHFDGATTSFREVS